MKHLLLFCAALCCAATSSAQKWEGLADTPPMGWSTWNKFGCNVDERMVREMADALVESGLAEADTFTSISTTAGTPPNATPTVFRSAIPNGSRAV